MHLHIRAAADETAVSTQMECRQIDRQIDGLSALYTQFTTTIPLFTVKYYNCIEYL